MDIACTTLKRDARTLQIPALFSVKMRCLKGGLYTATGNERAEVDPDVAEPESITFARYSEAHAANLSSYAFMCKCKCMCKCNVQVHVQV